MPYVSIDDLPDTVKHSLPKHAQEIFKEAFNNASDEYADSDESRAFRVAWAAVKKQYRKVDDKWVRAE